MMTYDIMAKVSHGNVVITNSGINLQSGLLRILNLVSVFFGINTRQNSKLRCSVW